MTKFYLLPIIILIPLLVSGKEIGDSLFKSKRYTEWTDTVIKQSTYPKALLVRLATKKNSIIALRKIGKNKLADKIENKQERINKSIIEAFRAKFDFCPTYFFFSDYTKDIKEKQFDKIGFLNGNLVADTTIRFGNTEFLSAEFGTIEQDTTRYYSNSDHFPTNKGMEKRKEYYGSCSMGFGALLIKSDQFVQLRRPFPYYVRTFDALPIIHRSFRNAVRIMNRRFHYYYRR